MSPKAAETLEAVLRSAVRGRVELATVATCADYDAPLVCRGGGTAMAGQTVNAAVVIDFSRHLNAVLDVDPGSRCERVQPGCVLDRLRGAAAEHGLTFGPDPATHDHCTLGGMIGNDSCGTHAGRTSQNVESPQVLTYDGLDAGRPRAAAGG
jgi:FAD/FMN-containing dehydrogenase